MKAEMLESLKAESLKSEPMGVTTIRLPPDLDQEMRAFAREHEIKYSVVLRRATMLGWEAMKEHE